MDRMIEITELLIEDLADNGLSYLDRATLLGEMRGILYACHGEEEEVQECELPFGGELGNHRCL